MTSVLGLGPARVDESIFTSAQVASDGLLGDRGHLTRAQVLEGSPPDPAPTDRDSAFLVYRSPHSQLGLVSVHEPEAA